jgi:hypothetical protein
VTQPLHKQSAAFAQIGFAQPSNAKEAEFHRPAWAAMAGSGGSGTSGASRHNPSRS